MKQLCSGCSSRHSSSAAAAAVLSCCARPLERRPGAPHACTLQLSCYERARCCAVCQLCCCCRPLHKRCHAALALLSLRLPCPSASQLLCCCCCCCRVCGRVMISAPCPPARRAPSAQTHPPPAPLQGQGQGSRVEAGRKHNRTVVVSYNDSCNETTTLKSTADAPMHAQQVRDACTEAGLSRGICHDAPSEVNS